MLEEKVNAFLEKATILCICLWGNWALYYWAAVLVFDVSYTSLKSYILVLLLQIAVSLFFLLRSDFRLITANAQNYISARRHPIHVPGTRFFLVSATVTIFAVAVILVADHFRWTRSSLSYNLFWATLLPFSLACPFVLNVSSDEPPKPVPSRIPSMKTPDCLLVFVTAIILGVSIYGVAFPTADDAFYGHVMSSTLANPDLPVQGQDLLFNTAAPYSLHPTYRFVGHEILIALLSEAMGIDPLRFYFGIMPVVGSIFWTLAVYMFMRALRTPYPGLALTVCLLVCLFWEPALPKVGMFYWGKNLVMSIGAPLLFFSVAVFMRAQSMRTWLLLLYSVCAVTIWSSTALFLVPLSVGLASLVFLPSIRGGAPLVLGAFLSLTPVFLLCAHGLLLLHEAPANTGGYGTGLPPSVHDEAFGGFCQQSTFLVMLLVLPLMARLVGDGQFQSNILRICMVGVFTVMAPFFIEAIAAITGLNFLSRRLQAAYPIVLLLGVSVSIAVTLLSQNEASAEARATKYRVLFLALISYGTVFGFMDMRYFKTDLFKIAAASSERMFSEGAAAKLLIPENSYVVAGSLNKVLPILPNPPTFIGVRHYLSYHKYFLSSTEFSDREYLRGILKKLAPRKGDDVEITLNLVLSKADKLGVTTFVFHVSGFEPNSDKSKFVSALTARLEGVGYDCLTIPSGKVRVCDKSPRPD